MRQASILIISILRIGPSTIAPSLINAETRVELLSLSSFPIIIVSNPVIPVPACKLKYLDSRNPCRREISNHCNFSNAVAIVALRKTPVKLDSTLSTNIALLLEL